MKANRMAYSRWVAIVLGGLIAMGAGSAAAQKQGGTLRVYNTTQPPSASIHEEIDDRHEYAVHGCFQQSRAL